MKLCVFSERNIFHNMFMETVNLKYFSGNLYFLSKYENHAQKWELEFRKKNNFKILKHNDTKNLYFTDFETSRRKKKIF